MHHGSISVESGEKKGTSFTVLLPVCQAGEISESSVKNNVLQNLKEGAVLAADQETVALPETDVTLQQKTTVLIIDDNQDVRDYVKVLLQEEYTVLEAANGQEGVKLAMKYVPGSVLFKNRLSEYVVLLRCEATDYEQDVLEVSNRIQTGLLGLLSMETSIGISEPVLLSETRNAFIGACEAIEQRYYLTQDSSIAVTKYTEIPDQKAAREQVEKQLPEAILSGSVSQVNEILNRTFTYVRSLAEEEQDNFMLFLLFLPARAVSGLKTQPGSPYRNQRKLVEHWLGCPSHVEQEQFLRQLMADSTELLQETGEPGTSAIVRQIKSIIDEQYMEQISVASLANQVHLTPTYLCVLFKQATGKTINEYLTNERIRHAKRLLRDPSVRLYDICYRVGYLSPSYFSKLFKKQTGMPPGEYRFQAQNETLTKG